MITQDDIREAEKQIEELRLAVATRLGINRFITHRLLLPTLPQRSPISSPSQPLSELKPSSLAHSCVTGPHILRGYSVGLCRAYENTRRKLRGLLRRQSGGER